MLLSGAMFEQEITGILTKLQSAISQNYSWHSDKITLGSRAGPRRSKDGGALTADGIIERRKPREGESMREVSPLIRASPGKFLKLDCLRVHFHAIFKSFSLILQADFIFFSVNFRRSRVRNILLWDHSLPPTDSRRAVVSFWQKNVHCTG